MAKWIEVSRAHSAVNTALRKKKLTKKPCEVCGSIGDVEAHHDDYSKPLDVKWLCPKHHKAEHATNGHRMDHWTVLNIRNVPIELTCKLKIEAIEHDKPMRELAIELLARPYIDAEHLAEDGPRGDGEGYMPPVIKNIELADFRPSDDYGVGKAPESVAVARDDPAVVVRRMLGVADAHNPKFCRIYRCGSCAVLGVKDKKRGLE